MIIGRPIEKLIDIVGEILAIATLVLILIIFINTLISFLPAETLDAFLSARKFLIIAVLSLKASEFALKRSVFIAIPCFIIILAAIIFALIPGFSI